MGKDNRLSWIRVSQRDLRMGKSEVIGERERRAKAKKKTLKIGTGSSLNY